MGVLERGEEGVDIVEGGEGRVIEELDGEEGDEGRGRNEGEGVGCGFVGV